jgi:hypothetical protein
MWQRYAQWDSFQAAVYIDAVHHYASQKQGGTSLGALVPYQPSGPLRVKAHELGVSWAHTTGAVTAAANPCLFWALRTVSSDQHFIDFAVCSANR